MGHLAVKDNDFVTAFTRITPLSGETGEPQQDTALATEKFKSRLAADRAILEARRKQIENDDELDFDLEDLKAFQFAVHALENADAIRKSYYILQTATVKIIIETGRDGDLHTQTYQRGRLRRISSKARSALQEFLMERAQLIRDPYPDDEVPEIPAESANPSTTEYEIELISDASPAALMTQATNAVQTWSSVAMPREELNLTVAPASIDGIPQTASAMMAAQEEIEIEAEAAAEAFGASRKSEREIGLEITAIIAKLSASYAVEDIRTGLKTLASYESDYSGILAGIAVPAFEDACLASYKRILTNKHGFIDDLDAELLRMAVEGGLDPEQAKREMADRALELFVNGLNPQSGKPLKKSRAEKIRSFAETAGKNALMKSPRFFQAKSIVNEIFVHETQKTPKPQRDREMCKLYTDLNIWVGNELE